MSPQLSLKSLSYAWRTTQCYYIFRRTLNGILFMEDLSQVFTIEKISLPLNKRPSLFIEFLSKASFRLLEDIFSKLFNFWKTLGCFMSREDSQKKFRITVNGFLFRENPYMNFFLQNTPQKSSLVRLFSGILSIDTRLNAFYL